MRKVLLLSLAMIMGLITATPPKNLKEATDALTAAGAAVLKATAAYTKEAAAAAKDKAVVAAQKAVTDVPGLKAGATDEDKKKYAATLAPLQKVLGEAVDTASSKTAYADLVKAKEAVVAAKAAVEGFYCDAAKLEFPLFTDDKCAKAVTGDAQKLPAGFTDAVTSGLKDAKKACVATGADKGTKSVKVTCELVSGKASITVASFSDDKCASAVQKDSKDVTATLAEGTCAANPATPTTFVKVGPKAAAAEEGMGVGTIVIIIVAVLAVCGIGYLVKTKYMGEKKD